MHNKTQTIYLGNTQQHVQQAAIKGNYVTLLGEQYYRISHYNLMPPFFMSIVSSADHWLFISSTGGLSAGRANAESALFPYYTVDKITENHSNSGNVAVLLVTIANKTYLWEPFSNGASLYHIERNLYKNIYGNKLIFEEINHSLNLSYRYAWRTSNKHGFIKSTWLKNLADDNKHINLVDGLQNLLPYGTSTLVQNAFSNLLNAYKRNELEPNTGLGLFTLSSTLTDLAEPSESLKATTVWQVGLDPKHYLLSANQLDNFRQGLSIKGETDICGYRGAYLLNATFNLDGDVEKVWHIVAEVNQDHRAVATLLNKLKQSQAVLVADLNHSINEDTHNLVGIMANADGLQLSDDHLSTAHHFANVLFNTMRGGLFANNYQINKADLIKFINVRNKKVYQAQHQFFANLADELTVGQLLAQASTTQSADLQRLCYEYLPLTFSRRHGDPSRPWNRFSINLKHSDGSPRLDYQGNWRDIFQNWEALLYAYPEFVESIICKFINATTADGYNPYRITREGIEWEKPNPEDPWANIGYWSDHQIIYLQKLLEISSHFYPKQLHTLLEKAMFSYANVPYRIKEYETILKDWYNTIAFDNAIDKHIDNIVLDMGSDGKLMLANGQVLHVNLVEKLLVLLLAKMTNFIPEGGIWMNTQRPEWNDANNALVGKGISVVTLCYLRRFIVFYQAMLTSHNTANFSINQTVIDWFKAIYSILQNHQNNLENSFNDKKRRQIMDDLGQAGSDYRWKVYKQGFKNEFGETAKTDLIAFLSLTQQYVEHSLKANKRDDGLYHAYNTLQLETDKAIINYLYPMLEGQVAILSSGFLSAKESVTLLQSLRQSDLYRPDQHSYMLYPNRKLPGFLEKNCLSAEQVKDSRLIATLIKHNDRRLINQDENGVYHFNGEFRNAKNVERVLKTLTLEETYQDLVEADRQMILDLFESTFNHNAFTGRSGTFFAYEGLGSIYWHMVSKLLLAVQETYLQAIESQESEETINTLADIYYDVRQGIGFNKSPEVYGAFPTDPYSHSPIGQGAKQPGLTGQVKEEVLTRLVELGLFIKQGAIYFNPVLLKKSEFLSTDTIFDYIDVAGQKQSITVKANGLAYTFCQVPIVYQASDHTKVEVITQDGQTHTFDSNQLNVDMSKHIFKRDGHVKQVMVYLKPAL